MKAHLHSEGENPNHSFALPDSQQKGIGIIGAGHLGRAIAIAHRQAGYPDEKIFISYAGRRETLNEIHLAGLAENISSNDDICQKASLIFITIRPQSLISLSNLIFPSSAIVISCMAGISTRMLKELWNIPVYRMMPSGPETILARESFAGLYPGSPEVIGHLMGIGLEVIAPPQEEQMDDLTAGASLPAALLVATEHNLDIDAEIRSSMAYGPIYHRVLSWAWEISPQDLSGTERAAYVTRMSTPGGITEAVCNSLREGKSMYQAYTDGINRSREIGEELSHLIGSA